MYIMWKTSTFDYNGVTVPLKVKLFFQEVIALSLSLLFLFYTLCINNSLLFDPYVLVSIFIEIIEMPFVCEFCKRDGQADPKSYSWICGQALVNENVLTIYIIFVSSVIS